MRDKLIELLENAESAVYWDSSDKSFVNKIADHLIANGVTVQQWIPVSERMPTEEENESIIIGIVNGYNGRIKFNDAAIQVRYDHKEKAWWSEDYDIEGCKVSQWYLVPEPPKDGE